MAVHIEHDLDRCVDQIIQTVGKQIVVGTPLGLGKANLLLNALYARAVADPSLSLTIFTALTLDVPTPRPGIEQRFMAPLLSRWFDGYPHLDYARARNTGSLPTNVTVHEFFMSPGKFLRNVVAQQKLHQHQLHACRSRYAQSGRQCGGADGECDADSGTP
ncbi:MAG: hypothetical protein AAF465_05465 [Pseudomonadota bacterium]